jgi:predicted nucleic-acid-binding protein
MVALIDTNIILDDLINREPFAEIAHQIFKKCADKQFLGFIAGHTIPDIFYILRKDYTAEIRRDMLLGICDTVDVVGVTRAVLIDALTNNSFPDFEDCLQAECAKAVNVDFIITRNIKDFAHSTIPAMTPEEFLERL